MPVAARLRRRAADTAPPAGTTAEGTTAAQVTAAEAAAAAGAARDLAAGALGGRPELAVEPEPVLGWGSHAYRVRLASDHRDWGAALVVRTAGPAAADNERAWLDVLAGAGFPVPVTVAHDPGTGALVFREPAGTPLAERMFAEMMALPRLLAGFGQLHARLHNLDLPAAGHPEPKDGDGVSALAAEAGDGAVAAAVGEEVGWVVAHRPPAGPPVICHGELNPVQVYSHGGGDDGDDGDNDDGAADGTVSVPVNWAGARTGDPELDVAATLTGFWSGALYIDSAVQRRVYRMAREPLASGYLNGYRGAAARPLDERRLRYWQVFHLCRLAAGIARCASRGPDGPWDPAAAVVQPRAALDEIRGRARELSAA